MAGTVHNVAGYAPAGYRLERTDYEGGAALHRFVCEGKPELVCVVGAHEDERGSLEAFRMKHDMAAIKAAEPVVEAKADTAPAAKPKRRW